MDGSAPLRQASWDWRAAGTFTFGGAGAGLAFCAAMLAFASHEHAFAAFLLAPLLLAGGIAAVWVEQGKPKDYLRVFFHPQTSWKTREALIGALLAVVTLVATVLSFTPVLLAVVLLAAGFLYTQGRILGDAGDTRLVPLVLSTGVAEGAGLLVVVAMLTGSDAAHGALSLTILLAALRWPVWTIYRDGLPAVTARAFGERNVAVVLWAPIVLLALGAVLARFEGIVGLIGWLAALAGGLATAASGWWLKYRVLSPASASATLPAPEAAAAKPAGEEGTPG